MRPYSRDVEDAFLVLEGDLTVGWADADGQAVEMELGPRDLVLNPAGQRHWLHNNGTRPETVRFEAA